MMCLNTMPPQHRSTMRRYGATACINNPHKYAP